MVPGLGAVIRRGTIRVRDLESRERFRATASKTYGGFPRNSISDNAHRQPCLCAMTTLLIRPRNTMQ